ncbi:MAG: FkbM family methyltransferase [Longimicrobiales bacterium]
MHPARSELHWLKHLGPGGYLRFGLDRLARAGRRLARLPRPGPHEVRPIARNCDGNLLYYRPYTSDLEAYRQIFIEAEFAPVGDLTGATTMIDGGGYVGFSSAWFLARNPDLRAVVLEPDPNNFAVLQRNLAPYADRVALFNAGVWSHECRLKPSSDIFRDGHEWTRSFEEASPGEEGAVEAMSIPRAIERLGGDRLSILKLDIEGAETVVFRHGADSWIDRVDLLVCELHHDSPYGDPLPPLQSLLEGGRWSGKESGELMIFRREG